MVSMDDAEENKKFAESLETSQVLLSDPEGSAARAYGVAGIGGLFAKRWTFYIDAEGVIREIDKAVSTSTAGQDIVNTLTVLGFPKKADAAASE